MIMLDLPVSIVSTVEVSRERQEYCILFGRHCHEHQFTAAYSIELSIQYCCLLLFLQNTQGHDVLSQVRPKKNNLMLDQRVIVFYRFPVNTISERRKPPYTVGLYLFLYTNTFSYYILYSIQFYMEKKCDKERLTIPWISVYCVLHF